MWQGQISTGVSVIFIPALTMEERLEKLADKTGRTKTWYARKAIETYLDDIEDAALAAAAYEEYILDGKASSSLEEVRSRLGLAD